MQYCTRQPSSTERLVDIHHSDSSQQPDRTVRFLLKFDYVHFHNKQRIHRSELCPRLPSQYRKFKRSPRRKQVKLYEKRYKFIYLLLCTMVLDILKCDQITQEFRQHSVFLVHSSSLHQSQPSY